MFLIRGVMLAGQFRTQHELNTMSRDGQRNTLIVEIAGRSKQTNLQSFNDDDLAGIGAVLVFLRTAGIRTDAQLKTLTADDMRNILIVELGAQTKLSGPTLQGMSNIELVLLGLGKMGPGALTQGSFIRGVMVAGKFRTQHELDTMTEDGQRNTLIVEIAGRTKQTNLQSLNDHDLAGIGALLVFLRTARIRTDGEIKSMTADDMRNVVIVEIGAQTNLGSKLQGLRNMDLVLTALGVDPVFFQPKPPLDSPVLPFTFRVDRLDVHTQKADDDHSDSDWLTIVVNIANPITKNTRTITKDPIRMEGSIKTGDSIAGNFASDPFTAEDSDLVIVTYMIINLGSSDAEEQFAQAVKVTDKFVGILAPVAGAAIGLFFGNPALGVEAAEQFAKELDTAISTLSVVFDFLGIHFAPANCNGEVLHDILTFQPGELARAVNQPSSREYTGSQENSRCGAPPHSTLHFSILRE